ncbi:hypothetical protein C1701_02965 [Actinoalloteichus sp. AHMU CJ021]|uniref:hypothetical protein n=1 Tax=Actinoalloteichus sp. AHMU CJ021 TaxID=2072503 RepID=UPI000CA069F3|nr:hypothetical protein C1701_02965 [Actinoalloteichus sp. AHMU CJ021]
MDVEVALYSGRPNPVFRLRGAEREEASRRLGALVAVPDRSAPPGGLGYQGFRLRPASSDGSSDAGAWEVGDAGDEPTVAGSSIVEYAVGGGLVVARGADGGVRVSLDPGRELERWLAERSTRALTEQEIRLVEGSLASEEDPGSDFPR